MEKNFYTPMLAGEDAKPNADWRRVLAQDYRDPDHHITALRSRLSSSPLSLALQEAIGNQPEMAPKVIRHQVVKRFGKNNLCCSL
jgi:hypothetical protein